MLRYLLVFVSVFASMFVHAQDKSVVTFNNPVPPRGYATSVQVDLGTCTMVIISGQVAMDKDGNLVGKGDLARQTSQIFINIKNIVEAAGGTMDHLVKFGIYMLDARQVQTVRDVRDTFINTKNPPASTMVQVSALFRPEFLIEIEATAIIPKN